MPLDKLTGTIAIMVALMVGVAPLGAEDVDLAADETAIFLADINNAELSGLKRLVRLPEFKSQGGPNWSQDGKLIAFHAWKGGETASNARIVIVNADGANPRVLGEGTHPSFSPEARRIAFTHHTQGVCVMSSEGPDSELAPVDEQGRAARWSPDGTRIAYIVESDGTADLAVFDLIEGGLTTLFAERAKAFLRISSNFAWSPDSARIVFTGTSLQGPVDWMTADRRGASLGLKFLRTTGKFKASEGVAWHPDGARILISRELPDGRSQLYWLDPAANDPSKLVSIQDLPLAIHELAFSPDGKRLAFVGKRVPEVSKLSAPK